MQKRDYKLSAICNISTRHLNQAVLEELPKKEDKVVPAKKKALPTKDETPDKEKELATTQPPQQDQHAPLMPTQDEDEQAEEEAQRKKKRRVFMEMAI